MRLAAVLVPLGLSLATAGGLMYYVSIKPAQAESVPVVKEVRHPVTKAMLVDAALMSERAAPFFKVKDAHGIDVQIGGAGKKPQLVYFILDGCPCSLDAQPLFNRLYERFKDKVDFIGVISAGKAKAIDYAGVNTVIHPIVCDEDLKIIKAYKARESTYNLIIRPDGSIEKLWPGYSKSILEEINSRLAALTKTTAVPFDAAYAPLKTDSGCFFY